MSAFFRLGVRGRRVWHAVAAATVAALALSGCGGGDDEDETHYSRDLTERCLRAIAKPGKPRDYIAQGAKEGAVRLVVEDQEVVVSFAQTIGEAEEIEEKYEPFGGKVVRKGTAVVRYSGEIRDESENSIEGCLRAEPAPS